MVTTDKGDYDSVETKENNTLAVCSDKSGMSQPEVSGDPCKAQTFIFIFIDMGSYSYYCTFI